jgi:SAM-dependent MidA family methyltransferase
MPHATGSALRCQHARIEAGDHLMVETATRTAVWVSIAGVVGTVLGTTIAPLVNYWTNERQMDVKMVEIGIGILRAPPKDDIAVMRSWAIDVIEQSSGRKFSPAQRAALLKQELPIRFWEWETVSPSQVDKLLKGLEPKR